MASTATYGEFKFNLASQGHYAAGSTFKVMVLMTALRKGVDPNSTSYTSMPLKFNDPTWGPIDVHTYSGSYIGRAEPGQGDARLRQLDLPAARPRPRPRSGQGDRDRHGHQEPRRRAARPRALGGLTKGVTPLEMANAYATIASNGWRNKVSAVRKVCFPKKLGGFDCKVEKARRHRAFEDGVTAEATKILKAERRGRHRHQGADRLPRRGQDRHGRRLHRRVVRRLHAAGWRPRSGSATRPTAARSARAPRAARSPRRSGAST